LNTSVRIAGISAQTSKCLASWGRSMPFITDMEENHCPFWVHSWGRWWLLRWAIWYIGNPAIWICTSCYLVSSSVTKKVCSINTNWLDQSLDSEVQHFSYMAVETTLPLRQKPQLQRSETTGLGHNATYAVTLWKDEHNTHQVKT
jgi:hypothetical protein